MEQELINRLVEDSNILDVFIQQNVEMKKVGDYFFVPCPGHDDKRMTNCYFKDGDSYCYCAACNQSYNSIHVIRNLTGSNFKESVKQLWDIEGRPAWFLSDQETSEPGITNADLQFLGISFISRKPMSENCHRMILSKELPSDTRCVYEDGEYRVYGIVRQNWRAYYSESELRSLVRKKCREKEKIFHKIKTLVPGIENSEEFQKQEKKLKRIRRWASE